MDAATLSSIGLGLDIAGVLLLFKYGLPNDIQKSTGEVLLWGTGGKVADKAAEKRWYRYRDSSRLALGMLVFGFALQIWSNHL
ncbi:MAG: hypothetical protein F4010_03615 [Cenarchaeum sp. SB0669_bin_11]|nr:hypothetical protein [Cenarchaeum sp. SB0669_bin_11]